MIVGRWYVHLAAKRHWYLPLCIYILLLNNFVFNYFCVFLFSSVRTVEICNSLL